MKKPCNCKHKMMKKDKKKEHKPTSPKGDAAKKKISKVMHEWKEGELHSGSKKGPEVKSRRQAVAIALSEARKNKKK